MTTEESKPPWQAKSANLEAWHTSLKPFTQKMRAWDNRKPGKGRNYKTVENTSQYTS